MRTIEIRDSGGLTGRVLDDVGTIVAGVHRAAAARVFDTLGPVAVPVRVVHDGISAIAYGSTRLGLRAIPTAAGAIGAGVAAARGLTTTSAYDSPTGRVVLSAVSGILGDTVEREHASLAAPLTVRTHGGPSRRTSGDRGTELGRDLASEPIAATGRVVVFAHGLCESDLSWSLGANRNWGDAGTTFGSLLRRDAGWTPLYLTYNSGRHVSDNGRDVAALLAEVLSTWPVPVTSIALVGHSMGGLVLRSAVAQSVGAAWTKPLSDMVFLGTPHLGAPLERGVHDAGALLARWPETAPFARYLQQRSVGVKDLRHGAVVAADWEGIDLDADRTDRCTVVPFPDGVRVHAVGVTLARRHDSALGRRAGDLLVQFDSAGSRGHATRTIPSSGVHHIGGLHHFDLLSHPAVYAALHDWLR